MKPLWLWNQSPDRGLDGGIAPCGAVPSCRRLRWTPVSPEGTEVLTLGRAGMKFLAARQISRVEGVALQLSIFTLKGKH